MCKHVAAVFYGIGARLDDQPELLFRLRKVDEKNLIAKAGAGLPLSKTGPATGAAPFRRRDHGTACRWRALLVAG